MTLKIAILLSGRGSNMQAIHRAIKEGRLDAKITAILSDQPEAAGLAYAQAEGILTHVVERQNGEDREAYDRRLISKIDEGSAQLVVLAGFMRLLSPAFIRHFPNRIVNIHPSLLPAFPGLHAQRQALEAGVRFSGCTVHFVDEGCDTGPIIDQRVVGVSREDTEASLSARILEQEHQLYPECLQKIAEGKI
ncbi:MAG: phosphoribosylglycinamide formyltransferase [Deltaproteobacteria bacterium]|nr:phosphoribosylglycinamide formyltransferase [Deltaproteobacteria bacterium]